MLYLILGILIGFIIWEWSIAIYAFKEVFNTKSVDELNKLVKTIQDCRIKNVFILILAIIVRTPLLLAVMPFLIIHIAKLYIKESK